LLLVAVLVAQIMAVVAVQVVSELELDWPLLLETLMQ
jgi:hypothetical protein